MDSNTKLLSVCFGDVASWSKPRSAVVNSRISYTEQQNSPKQTLIMIEKETNKEGERFASWKHLSSREFLFLFSSPTSLPLCFFLSLSICLSLSLLNNEESFTNIEESMSCSWSTYVKRERGLRSATSTFLFVSPSLYQSVSLSLLNNEESFTNIEESMSSSWSALRERERLERFFRITEDP